MSDEIVIYRRNLPHIHPKDGIFFITFRLAGSLPIQVLQELSNEKKKEINQVIKKYGPKEIEQKLYRIEKRYFGRYDHLLDHSEYGPQWLNEDRIAQIVTKRIHEMDDKHYRLIAYCIMPNHVHILFDTKGFIANTRHNKSGRTKNYPLADTLRLLKGNTARLCNIELKRKGHFWHHESYDHFVRDGGEMDRIIFYILNNPVKAGLVADWKEWKYNYYASQP